MKRLTVLAALTLAPPVWGEDCASRTEAAYVQIQALYASELSATDQLALLDILKSLCTAGESSVQPHPQGTRYSTKSRKPTVEQQRIDPVWVGIDWYRGRAGNVGREDRAPDYAIPPYPEDISAPQK